MNKLAKLQKELHQEARIAAATRSGFDEVAGHITRAPNWAVGRIVVDDALEVVQESLVASASGRGLRVLSRRANPGIAYARVSKQDIPTIPKVLAAVIEARSGSGSESGDRYARLLEPIRHVGAVALVKESRRQDSRTTTNLFLEIQDPSTVDRLQAEQTAVSDAVDSHPINLDANGTPKPIRLPLIAVFGKLPSDVMDELRAVPLPLPEDLALVPTGVYDNAAIKS